MPQEVVTEDALAQKSTTPPVGDSVVGPSGAVDEGMGSPDEQTISAARFNGLMSEFHKEQARVRVLEAELATARQPAEPATKKESPAVSDADALATMQAQIAQLTALLTEERSASSRESALATALKEHPEAAPFANLIVGDSPEDIADMVKTVASIFRSATAPKGDAVSTVTPEPVASAGPAAVAAVAPVVLGAGTSAPLVSSAQDAVKAAMDAARASGGTDGFADVMKAKWAGMAAAGDLAGLELS